MGLELDSELNAEDKTDIELDAKDKANKTLEWRDLDNLDENFNIILKAKVILFKPIEISFNNFKILSEFNALSDSAADIFTDLKDKVNNEINSEDKAAKEIDPKIYSILASSDNELDKNKLNKELLPLSKDI